MNCSFMGLSAKIFFERTHTHTFDSLYYMKLPNAILRMIKMSHLILQDLMRKLNLSRYLWKPENLKTLKKISRSQTFRYLLSLIKPHPLLTTPFLRENFPQTYCLIRKFFLRASPPDPLYIRRGSGGGAPQEKNCEFRGHFWI